MYRLVAVAVLIFLVHCSTSTGQTLADASAEGSADAAASDGGKAGKDSGNFPGCRPTGAACADNVMACCSMGCRSTVDLNDVQHSACD